MITFGIIQTNVSRKQVAIKHIVEDSNGMWDNCNHKYLFQNDVDDFKIILD